MSQGMQRVCFLPPPKSLSMMGAGVNHRPCPSQEQGAHEASLRPSAGQGFGSGLGAALGRDGACGGKGGEWRRVLGAQSPFIVSRVRNKIRLRGHVPRVIYKHDGCMGSRRRFSFQQKHRFLLIFCPTSRLRDCPSRIRKSVEALKNILKQFQNPHGWGEPPTTSQKCRI